MKNRTYHILGSDGFIGSILMRELPKYCDNVIGINRNIIKDFTDLKEMKKYFKSMDNINSYVINCAASGGKELLGGYNKDELWNNIKINDNIMSLRDYYRFYINIGSGAELNKSNPIIDATEHDCMTILPTDSYGMSKNIIAKRILSCNGGLNLRLFGVFDYSEPSYRFFKTCINNIQKEIPIEIMHDNYFSWVSGIDLGHMVSQIDYNKPFTSLDLNCAYSHKIRLSEFAYHVSRIYGKHVNIIIHSNYNKEYTCNSYLLESEYKWKYGLENSIIEYSDKF